MHRYSINSKNRETVIYVLVIISVALSFMLKGLLSTVLVQINDMVNQVSWLTEFSNIIKSAELLPNVIGVPVIYWVLSSVFDKWIWKSRPLNRILDVPNLNGTWKGMLHSSYDENDYEMVLVIKQTWIKIQCTSKFENSESNSNVAAVYSDVEAGQVLYFGFRNQSSNTKAGSQLYDGYNILKLEGNILSGNSFRTAIRADRCKYANSGSFSYRQRHRPSNGAISQYATAKE